MEAVVVDAGSKLLKAGPAIPDQAPAMIIPTQMKRMPDDGLATDSSLCEDITVDPVVRGVIRDWDAMEDLLHHVLYTGLGWEIGNEGQILFTDPLCTPKAVREQLVQLMFETFNISGFYASEQAVLSLYAVGRISGCTVDIGHGKIDIAPVIEGAVHHIASKRFEIGGTDLTKLLAQELGKSNPGVNISMSDIEKIKEQYSCCAEDELAYEKTGKSCQTEQHTLPDGQVITIGRERYTVGEALFQPSILGLEAHGIVEQLVRTISTVSSDNHRQLLENTVLCGGTTSMPGFEERFQKEAGLCSSAVRPALVKVLCFYHENAFCFRFHTKHGLTVKFLHEISVVFCCSYIKWYWIDGLGFMVCLVDLQNLCLICNLHSTLFFFTCAVSLRRFNFFLHFWGYKKIIWKLCSNYSCSLVGKKLQDLSR
ncbi:actin-related protein 7 isoform X1 [Cannabis sativa]|uniref:actin-related protein 7 isoform X1 n=1 Tax=Cannabis sativa TaxID=3483 RepID=UPI0029C9DC90|nr:actin-related protein 7 isoform X1 [Cannabis sativa]